MRIFERSREHDALPFLAELQRNRYTDAFTVHKFGNASDIDIADGSANVWDGTCSTIAYKIAQYTYSPFGTADITQVSSTIDTDRQLTNVQGLDIEGNLVVQLVTLQGQTPVPLPTPLWRVFRVYNDDTYRYDGDVYVSTSDAVITNGLPALGEHVRAIVKDGDNQTQMALFTVPKGYKMYITRGWANLSRKNAATVQITIWRRKVGKVFRITHTLALSTQGNTGDQRPYEIPIVFDELEDLEYKANTTANDTGVSAGFHAFFLPK